MRKYMPDEDADSSEQGPGRLLWPSPHAASPFSIKSRWRNVARADRDDGESWEPQCQQSGQPQGADLCNRDCTACRGAVVIASCGLRPSFSIGSMRGCLGGIVSAGASGWPERPVGRTACVRCSRRRLQSGRSARSCRWHERLLMPGTTLRSRAPRRSARLCNLQSTRCSGTRRPSLSHAERTSAADSIHDAVRLAAGSPS